MLRRRLARALSAAAATLLVAVTAGTAYSATPSQIAARLNAERDANGLPGRIELNAAWSVGCAHHIRYEQLNGIPLTHVEQAGRPGYTKDGQRAALGGDQSKTSTSFDETNPFENLPYHMITLLSPTLTEVGAYEQGGRTCVQIGGWRRFESDSIFTVPGPGRQNVPGSQVVQGELPYAPGDLVGLPQGTPTGPHIYLFAAGPWVDTMRGGAKPPVVTVVAASLRGPDGPVAIRIVDGRRFPGTFLGAYHAAILIPVRPLVRGVYSAEVTLRAGKVRMTRRWRFATSSVRHGGRAVLSARGH